MPQTAFPSWTYNDPFADMRHLQGAMNRMFEGSRPRARGRTGTYPAVNFWAGQDSVVMTTDLPGLTEQDIDLSVKDTLLTLRGTMPEAEAGEDAVWHRRERPAGAFLRSIELPFRIDPDRIEARFENGVLTVELQRPEADKPKRIQIKTS